MARKKTTPPTILLALTLLVALFAAKELVLTSAHRSDILGTSTWIAKGGDDNSGSGSSGSGKSEDEKDEDEHEEEKKEDKEEEKHEESNSGSGKSESESKSDDGGNSGSSSSRGGSSSSGGGSSDFSSVDKGGSLSLPSSTYGKCEGPDHKKFNTTFGACSDLNKSWGRSSFEFEKIETKRTTSEEKVEKEEDHDEAEDEREDESEVEHENENENEVENEGEAENESRVRVENTEDEQRTEVRISETERIRTRTKDGETRIDITSGGVKTRLERKDDKIVIKAETEDETEVELEDDTIVKIEERLDKSNIKVSTGSAEAFVIQRGAAAVKVNFPVSIDLATNTLSVETPQGEKVLTVLPDQVVSNLLVTRVIDRLDSSLLSDEFQTGELAAVSDVLQLESNQDELVYEIKGFSNQRFLGLFPVTIEKDVTVSAETGELLSEEKGFVDTVVDALSF